MLIRLHLIEVFSITLAESIVGIELELGRLDGVDATVQGRAEHSVATTGTTDRNVANNGTSRVHGVVEKSYATGPHRQVSALRCYGCHAQSRSIPYRMIKIQF
jgi:hypothetical protein